VVIGVFSQQISDMFIQKNCHFINLGIETHLEVIPMAYVSRAF
jgi:hypothetical protein